MAQLVLNEQSAPLQMFANEAVYYATRALYISITFSNEPVGEALVFQVY